jgi:UPF0755 protein
MRGPAVLLLAFTVTACGVGFWMAKPYRSFSGPVLVDLPVGTGARAMAELLERKGIIQHRSQLLLVRALRPSAKLQAGEYKFDQAATVWEVFERIVRGDVVYYDLTIPEGYNMFEIARAVEDAGIASAGEFLKAARDASLVTDLAPRAVNLEGYLFPSTYRFTRSTTARRLCQQMTAGFRKQWTQLGGGDAHYTVTLASMVEKETSIASERSLVASVYANRLRLGMRLECDPTTIYAAILAGKWRGTLFRSDLERDHPYNTYQRVGLPPGPIANPGLAALRAALRPAETSYLYFVAEAGASGAHRFSTDYSGHLKAVTEYRRGEKRKTGKESRSARMGGSKRAAGSR